MALAWTNPGVTAAPRVSPWVALGAIVVMLLWALCFPLITIGLKGAPPMAFAAMRAFVAGLSLLVFASVRSRPPVPDGSAWRHIALVGLSATGLGFFGMFYGGERVSPGIATVIANTQPLIAALIGWHVLGERLRGAQKAGMAVGFAGIVLIAAPGIAAHSSVSGIVWILLGAVGVATGNVLLKRLAGGVDIFRAMGWQLMIGSIPLAGVSLLREDVMTIQWSPEFVLTLLVLSLAGTAAVFVLWFALLARARLNQLNVFTFLTPVFGLLIGWWFFDEQIGPLAAAGIALSLAGIVQVTRRGSTDG